MTGTGGFLTTHVLDTALGVPAANLEISLYRLDGPDRIFIRTLRTNADGRTDSAILPTAEFSSGRYELVFKAGAYLDGTDAAGGSPRFLDDIPIRFGISDPASHYHVPLLLSAHGYSTYRGS